MVAGRKPIDGVTRERHVTLKISDAEYKHYLFMAKKLQLPKMVFARNMFLLSLENLPKIDCSDLVGVKLSSEFLRIAKEKGL